jgi:hypothetical protein
VVVVVETMPTLLLVQAALVLLFSDTQIQEQ